MKSQKNIVAIILIFLTVIGWFSFAISSNAQRKSYVNTMAEAEKYMETKRYQLAIEEQKKVLEYKNTEENWDKLFEAYEKRFVEDINILSDFIKDLNNAISRHGYKEKYVIRLSELYMFNNNYKNAYACLAAAVKTGVKPSTLQEYMREIRYAFTIKTRTFSSFLPYSNSAYSVYNGNMWGAMNTNGAMEYPYEYQFIGQSNFDGGVRLFSNEKDSRLIDDKGIVLGIFDFVVKEAGIYSEGLIPILRNDDLFYYYNADAEKLFGGFEEAGSFIDGKAAVKKNGRWAIINNKGKSIDDNRFDDIRFTSAGYYTEDKIIVASQNGKYQIYDQNFQKIGKFSCDNFDIITDDGLLAFESGGKWGFVDRTGKIVIEPQYDSARSFSHGMAAISINGEWGFIDTDNNIAIDCQFAGADYFNQDGSCLVRTDVPDVDDEVVWQMLALRMGIIED